MTILAVVAVGQDAHGLVRVGGRMLCGVVWVLWLGTMVDWVVLRLLLLRGRVPSEVVATLDRALLYGVLTQREWVRRRDTAPTRLGVPRLPLFAWRSVLGEGAFGAWVRMELVDETTLLRSAETGRQHRSDPVVSLVGIDVARGGSLVLRDLNLSLPAGQWLVVCGPSGAGKSTLLRLIAGLVAVSAGRIAVVFSSQGERVWSSEQHPSTVSAVGWVTSNELASACYGRVAFFDIPSGRENQRLEWKGSLVSMALSPDGGIVACGSQDNSVHFWRREDGKDSMMSGYPSKPSALAFSRDGVLLATSGGTDVTVWSFADGGPEGTRPGVLEIHAAPVTALAFSHRGRRLASGGRDAGVVVWKLGKHGNGQAVGAAFATAGCAERAAPLSQGHEGIGHRASANNG